MKTVILAGGLGTRLSEYTHSIPKPMVEINNIPILVHILSIYSNSGFNEFVIATGYKHEIINNFFIKYSKILKAKKNFLKLQFKYSRKNINLDCQISIVFTGLRTMTGGRLKKLQPFLKDKTFMLTYGDGLAKIDIKKLVSYHLKKKKIATLTAVRPPVRFGELSLSGNLVRKFEEKPKLSKGWINGGFFVFDSKIFNYIKGSKEMLEREPMKKLTKFSQLTAFKLNNFWQCMDSKRDKDLLEKMYKKNKFLWLK